MAGSVEQAHHNSFLGMDFGVVFCVGGNEGGGEGGGGAEDVSALASFSPRSLYSEWCIATELFDGPDEERDDEN